MGEGKTEAALYLQDRWQNQLGQSGCYIALPTQATSNQMFHRVHQFLSNRYKKGRVNYHLVHGGAALSDEYQMLKLAAVEPDVSKEGHVVAEQWFLPKKRVLLSLYGVGTIDQALLSVLQVRHGFVRLFGLANKVVVIDEVHAYDTYTSTLIDRLISWLSALNCSVILMSATLPKQRRTELIKAYAGSDVPIPETHYPRVTWVTKAKADSVHFRAKERPAVFVELRDRQMIIQELVDTITQGGCAAWICNTVNYAQEIFSTLKPLCDAKDIELLLFHARFPLNRRRQIEDDIIRRFGTQSLLSPDDPKYYPRPTRCILIATQVIEQSLDLDFDLEISEVAPIDLVLQRLGRLHRHQRHRPNHLAKAQLWIPKPDLDEKQVPNFGINTEVYEEYILLRTWLTLQHLEVISNVQQIEQLVEAVYDSPNTYDDLCDALRNRLEATYMKARDQRESSNLAARSRTIPPAEDPDEFIEVFNQQLIEDDDPCIHPTLQAATRLSEPSVQVVCLHLVDGRIYTEPDGSGEPIELSQTPDFALGRQLIERTVTISHRGIVKYFAEQDPPDAWKHSSLLRHHRLAVFHHGIAVLCGCKWQLRYDETLGIIIEKAEEVSSH